MLRKFLKGSLGLFVLSIICSACVSVLDLLSPKLVGDFVDAGLKDRRAPLIIVGVALLAALFRYGNKVTNSMAAERLVERMRNLLFEQLERLPYSWYGENKTGDIIQRCTSDVETVKQFLSEELTGLFRVVILIIIAIGYMLQIDGRLTLVSVIFIPIIVGYSLVFHVKIGSAFQKCDEQEGVLSAIAQENLTGVRVVRAFGRETYERQRFEKQNKEYTQMWVRLMQLLSAFWASGDLISGLQVMSVTVFGAIFCVHGEMTAGQFISFVSYNGLLTWPVRNLGRIIADMSKAGISIGRIRYIMAAPVEADKENAKTPPLDGDIVFDHVSYRYENGSAEVLEDVSFTVEAGKTIGILGGTGSGKSTLMYLLDRLYPLDPSQGKITIGGVDIADMEAKWLRENIGMVLQEPYLFSRTLSENIAIAKPSADMKDIRRAAHLASLSSSVDRFSQGYETYVGERGVTLSGGQKQRTAIAQMLIREPRIMVFDDSLSAVDAETDAKIRGALKENVSGSTVILIAHRITTLMHADKIIVLDKGHVAEEGNHEQLMAQNGLYRKIFDLQAAGAEA